MPYKQGIFPHLVQLACIDKALVYNTHKPAYELSKITNTDRYATFFSL